MFDRIQKLTTNHYVKQLRDIQSLGLIAFAVIVVLVSISGVKAIQLNYKLEQQISDLQQQNTVQQLKNQQQQLKNQYYNTPQYLELAARQNFGLALPGETEYLVPKDVALNYVKGVKDYAKTSGEQTETEAARHVPFFQRNLQAWMNFFLHRTKQV